MDLLGSLVGIYSTVSHGFWDGRESYEHRLGIQMAYRSVSLFHSRARTGPLDASYGFWLGGHGSKALGSLTVISTWNASTRPKGCRVRSLEGTGSRGFFVPVIDRQPEWTEESQVKK